MFCALLFAKAIKYIGSECQRKLQFHSLSDHDKKVNSVGEQLPYSWADQK